MSTSMKNIFAFNKRTFLIFSGLGILVFIANFLISIHWLKHSSSFLAYSPWAVLCFLLLADIRKRNFSRSISFFSGLALTYLLFIGNVLLFGHAAAVWMFR